MNIGVVPELLQVHVENSQKRQLASARPSEYRSRILSISRQASASRIPGTGWRWRSLLGSILAPQESRRKRCGKHCCDRDVRQSERTFLFWFTKGFVTYTDDFLPRRRNHDVRS